MSSTPKGRVEEKVQGHKNCTVHTKLGHREGIWECAADELISSLLEINADLLAALEAVQQLFAPKDSFYIRKFGVPMTNADQAKVDKVFIAVDAAIAQAKGQSQ